jgi:hypothetical protein
VLDEIPEELLPAQPWLNEHRRESVTALEILHGVLRNPDLSGHAHFYFRDPSCSASNAAFREEDPVRRDLLAALKNEIRGSVFPVAENFNCPKQLGEWVLRDLTAVIAWEASQIATRHGLGHMAQSIEPVLRAAASAH